MSWCIEDRCGGVIVAKMWWVDWGHEVMGWCPGVVE